MKIGIQLPKFDQLSDGPAGIGPALAAIAREADQAGLESLWVMDHFFQIEHVGDIREPMLEGYTTLAFLAGQTERIALGTMVTGVTYRHPGILVKTVTTLDVLSGGRAWLGIGAAWFEREHRALGVPFPATSERFERLEEALQIANQMWSDNDGPYEGKHYQLAETLCQPQPLSLPKPRIMIGGGGERKTLRLVARYADGCNLFAMRSDEGLRELGHKLDVLRQHCEAEGRPYDAIEKTAFVPAVAPFSSEWTVTPDEFVAHAERLADLGIDQVITPVVNREMLGLLTSQVAPRLEAVAAR